MKNANNFKHLQTWGCMMGSFQYYIDRKIDEAIADNAPDNAIYKNSENEWVTFDDVTNSEVIRYFNLRGLK